MSFEITNENKEYFDKFRFRERIVSAANLYELLMPDGSTKTIVLPMVRHYSPDAHQHLWLWKDVGIKKKKNLNKVLLLISIDLLVEKKH